MSWTGSPFIDIVLSTDIREDPDGIFVGVSFGNVNISATHLNLNVKKRNLKKSY